MDTLQTPIDPTRPLATAKPWLVCAISRGQWYKLAASGRTPLPTARLGTRRSVYLIAELEAWLKAGAPDRLTNDAYAVQRGNDLDYKLPPEVNKALAADGSTTAESLARINESTEAEVVREVSARIDATIEANRRSERLIIGVLLALFFVGFTLILWGALVGWWELLVAGELIVALPVRRLIKLREDNIRLQIIPQLLRLAESEKGKALAAKLAERLINQV